MRLSRVVMPGKKSPCLLRTLALKALGELLYPQVQDTRPQKDLSLYNGKLPRPDRLGIDIFLWFKSLQANAYLDLALTDLMRGLNLFDPKHVKSMDFDGVSTHLKPKFLYCFPNLEKLTLTAKNLDMEDIPKVMGRLLNLQYLTLSGYSITKTVYKKMGKLASNLMNITITQFWVDHYMVCLNVLWFVAALEPDNKLTSLQLYHPTEKLKVLPVIYVAVLHRCPNIRKVLAFREVGLVDALHDFVFKSNTGVELLEEHSLKYDPNFTFCKPYINIEELHFTVGTHSFEDVLKWTPNVELIWFNMWKISSLYDSGLDKTKSLDALKSLPKLKRLHFSSRSHPSVTDSGFNLAFGIMMILSAVGDQLTALYLEMASHLDLLMISKHCPNLEVLQFTCGRTFNWVTHKGFTFDELKFSHKMLKLRRLNMDVGMMYPEFGQHMECFLCHWAPNLTELKLGFGVGFNIHKLFADKMFTKVLQRLTLLQIGESQCTITESDLITLVADSESSLQKFQLRSRDEFAHITADQIQKIHDSIRVGNIDLQFSVSVV